MDTRRCPDCGVTMESTAVRSSDGFGLTINTGKLEGVCCPECGLVRLYAALEESG